MICGNNLLGFVICGNKLLQVHLSKMLCVLVNAFRKWLVQPEWVPGG